MKKKALQRLTNTPPAVLEILNCDTITQEQISALTRAEVCELNRLLTERFNSDISPAERDRLWGVLEPIVDEQTKNVVWENNHTSITARLSNYLNEYNVLPTKQKLSELTGLSRQTIHKHLKEYGKSPYFKYRQEALELLSENLIGRLYTFACAGNVQAAKLFLEITGAYKPASRAPEQPGSTTNYVQINNTIFTQENLRQLAPEQLAEVEKVLHKALSK